MRLQRLSLQPVGTIDIAFKFSWHSNQETIYLINEDDVSGAKGGVLKNRVYAKHTSTQVSIQEEIFSPQRTTFETSLIDFYTNIFITFVHIQLSHSALKKHSP